MYKFDAKIQFKNIKYEALILKFNKKNCLCKFDAKIQI
jgi:hypothetical protein